MVNNNKKNKQETVATSKKYVVTRSGIRVSDIVHDKMEDASEEFEHWQRIVNRWPDGTNVMLEEYTEKHRIY